MRLPPNIEFLFAVLFFASAFINSSLYYGHNNFTKFFNRIVLLHLQIKKNLANIEKHGVSFKMAASSFFDPNAVVVDDDAHSHDEDRFILIGVNKYDKLLTVCHCFRDDGNVIRIISARKPNQTEKEIYGGEF